MEAIILIGHGSPKKSANTMDHVCSLLHARIHPGCAGNCVRSAYLQYDTPTVEDAIKSAVADRAKSIVLHPYFLNAGVHVTSDIPEIIEQARADNPSVEFVYTDPLGISEKLVNVVIDRINAAKGIATPDIEPMSFDAITGEADLSRYPSELHPIVKRVIHTTADFEFATTMLFHPDALSAGLAAIRAGMDIVTDVEMVRTGINKTSLAKFGGKAVCRLDSVSASHDRTRTEAAMEEALHGGNVGMVAIGNAPTALLKCIDLVESGRTSAKLVIGMPVGFVRATESKAALARAEFPFITNVGRKGGSPVAAAIVNALLKIAEVHNA